MARWAEAGFPGLLVALVVAGLPQAPPPAASAESPSFPRAVLLEAGDLYTRPSSDGEIVQRLDAGAVLAYGGTITDAFGRTWNVVRDPGRLERASSTYLAAFDVRDLLRTGYRAALLADRAPPSLPPGAAGLAAAGARAAATPAVAGQAPSSSWWETVAAVEPTNQVAFGDIVGVSAVTVRETDVREAVELLGGREAIAVWPADPQPAELFVPPMMPALYQYDGERWDLARPLRFLGENVNLLGNSSFLVDREAPPLAGGPALHCWELVNALDERGDPAGGVSVAPAPQARRGQAAAVDVDMGAFDPAGAPAALQGLLPPAPGTTRVPPRVDPPEGPSGVLLADSAGRQAVYLQQRLGSALTRRLRGRAVVVDVVARDDPRAGPATFGINVDAIFADDRPPQPFAEPYTSREAPARYQLAFEVPDDADDLVVRLLPLDRTLAVEQQGSVIFEHAGLRLAGWDPQPTPATIILHRVVVGGFEGAQLYTRAAVAPTDRAADAVERIWPAVARSEWSVEDRRHVLAGTLRTGMDREQVATSWGRPAAENAQSDGEGVEWRWDRDDRYVVFVDGLVVAFRPPADDEVEVTQPMCPAAMALPDAATAAGSQGP